MDVLVLLGVVDVAEAHGLGQLLDGSLLAGEEVPALGGAGPAVAGDVGLLLRRPPSRVSRGSKLTVTTLNSLPTVNGMSRMACDQPVEHQRAEHGAAVVGQHQDHRLLAEIIAQPHRLAGLIGERQVQGHLLVEPLVEAHVLQARRAACWAAAASGGGA